MPRKKVEVPKRILSVVERAKKTGHVVKTLPIGFTGENLIHWNYADGSDAPDLSVRQAIELGLLLPSGDGLFGTEMSQTFRAP